MIILSKLSLLQEMTREITDFKTQKFCPLIIVNWTEKNYCSGFQADGCCWEIRIVLGEIRQQILVPGTVFVSLSCTVLVLCTLYQVQFLSHSHVQFLYYVHCPRYSFCLTLMYSSCTMYIVTGTVFVSLSGSVLVLCTLSQVK